MPRRLRKFIGTCITLVFVCAYALAAMTVAQTDHIRNANGLLQGLFFCVVGLAWILPLMPLIRWMERAGATERAAAQDLR